MQKQYGWRINRKIILRSGLITALSFIFAYLLVLLIAPSFFEPWQNKLVDGLFHIRYFLRGRGEVSPYIIHAVLNDTSYRVLSKTYRDKYFYGRMLSIISEAGVKAVACDIFFSEESIQRDDRRLVETVAREGNIYFPVILHPPYYTAEFNAVIPGQVNEELIEKNLFHPKIFREGCPLEARFIIAPFSELAEASRGLGHITCEPDSDGINRRFPLIYKYKNGYFPALAFRMLCDFFKVEPSEIEVAFGRYIRLPQARCGEFVRKDITIPVDEQGRMFINFTGSWEDSFIHFPIHNLITVESDDELKLQLYDDFEGSLVVFSDTSTRNKDYSPGIFDRVYPLSGLHLSIANTILTENFIYKADPAANIVIMFITALILWLFSFSFRPPGFLISSLCLLLLSILFFVWLFIGFKTITMPIPNALGFCFSLILISFYRFVIEEQEKKVLTTRALTAAKLEETNRALQEIEQYRKHFIQNITHEFRTPLTLIVSPLEVLLGNRGRVFEPEVDKMLGIIAQSSQKLLYLIDQLLDLSKIESGKIKLAAKKHDIVNFLSSIVAYFMPLAESRGVRLRFEKMAGNFSAIIDREKMEKVLSNLISNAIKYSERGDEITVECEAPVFTEILQVDWPSLKPQEAYRISVRDTGSGIDEKACAAIFERFEQAGSPAWKGAAGTGIGLALVKEYVTLHHGVITVKSIPGKGSVFTMYLPAGSEVFEGDGLSPDGTGTGEPGLSDEFKTYAGTLISDRHGELENDEIHVDDTGGEKKTILIVEDDERMRVYLRFLLEERYRVYEAADGEKGFRMAVEFKPALIITDLRMPGMNGQDLISALRREQSTAHIPVILITARTPAETPQKEQEEKPDDYLSKPFSAEELKVRVKNLLTISLFKKNYIHQDNDDARRTGVKQEADIFFPHRPVLLVDDERFILEAYRSTLGGEGITNTLLCDDGRGVMPLLFKTPVSCVVLDLSMPHVSGVKLLGEIKQHYPEVPVIVVTGINNVETAVSCMRMGAYDYLVKPVEKGRLSSVIRHCMEERALAEECARLQNSLTRGGLEHPEAFSNIITQNKTMLDTFRLVESYAGGNQPVLITGESGVGKELIAEAIHVISGRTGKYIRENIAGLDSTIFSDTLFGHVKGAYTGALSNRKGLVEEAAGGTLFLDEIGELDPESQVKLLRFLEYREYRPLGFDNVKLSDARIIAATNVDLSEKIEGGRFRKDLYYRLSQKIHIPPLRERPDDIPLLLEHFLEKTAKAYGKKKPEVGPDVISLLKNYHYPGNIREFAMLIERAMGFKRSPPLDTGFLLDYIREHGGERIINIEKAAQPARLITYSGDFPSLFEVEYFFIKEAMKKAGGNQRVASKLLGLSTSALNRRLKKLKMQ
jgi:DNA-binding NtrC family response regulator/signal transduction histidine kinase